MTNLDSILKRRDINLPTKVLSHSFNIFMVITLNSLLHTFLSPLSSSSGVSACFFVSKIFLCHLVFPDFLNFCVSDRSVTFPDPYLGEVPL